MDPLGAVVCHLCVRDSPRVLEAAAGASLLCRVAVEHAGRDLSQLSAAAAAWGELGPETTAMPGCGGAQPALSFAWGSPKTLIPELTGP